MTITSLPKFLWLDRLPNFLSNGALLMGSTITKSKVCTFFSYLSPHSLNACLWKNSKRNIIVGHLDFTVLILQFLVLYVMIKLFLPFIMIVCNCRFLWGLVWLLVYALEIFLVQETHRL